MIRSLIVLIGLFGLVCEAATWTASNAPSGSWRGVAMSTSGQYAAASSQGGGIYYSSDYGVTWTASSASTSNHIFMAGSDSGQYLVVSVWADRVHGHVKKICVTR